jgi:hypothetical protein
LKLQYLPDFAEEYSLHITPGIGAANVQVQLDQGWNLTQINQDLDSQLDENLEAVADLAGALAKTAGPRAPSDSDAMVVQATNVPIGFYESVVGPGPNGKKQLYGWRYVGFAPFNTCPTQVTGGQSVCCDDPSAAIYGLVFQNGVMVFRPLHEIASVDEGSTTRVPRPEVQLASESTVTTAVLPESVPNRPVATEAICQNVERHVRAHRDVLQFYGAGATVSVRLDRTRQNVVFIVKGAGDDPGRRARAEQQLARLPEVEQLRAGLGEPAQVLFLYE